MAVSPASFRANFPVFADPAAYPDAVVQFFIDLAYMLLSAQRWGALLDTGVQFYLAHNLLLERAAQLAAEASAVPGTPQGPQSSQSAGPLSMSWDTGSAAEKEGGTYNQTTYGQRYIRLARLVGMGPLQLGIGCAPPGALGMAWSGPPQWPGWV